MGHAYTWRISALLRLKMKHLPIFAVLICFVSFAAVDAEVGMFSLGYESQNPGLGRLEAALIAAGSGRLERQFPAGLYGTFQLSWLAPPARWVWLNANYSHYAAESRGEDTRLGMHIFELGPAVYVDLFKFVWFCGGGATLVKTNFVDRGGVSRGRTDGYVLGGRAAIGVARPLIGRIGFWASVEGRVAEDFDIGGYRANLDGAFWRIGVAYLPDGDSRVLNW